MIRFTLVSAACVLAGIFVGCSQSRYANNPVILDSTPVAAAVYPGAYGNDNPTATPDASGISGLSIPTTIPSLVTTAPAPVTRYDSLYRPKGSHPIVIPPSGYVVVPRHTNTGASPLQFLQFFNFNTPTTLPSSTNKAINNAVNQSTNYNGGFTGY